MCLVFKLKSKLLCGRNYLSEMKDASWVSRKIGTKTHFFFLGLGSDFHSLQEKCNIAMKKKMNCISLLTILFFFFFRLPFPLAVICSNMCGIVSLRMRSRHSNSLWKFIWIHQYFLLNFWLSSSLSEGIWCSHAWP